MEILIQLCNKYSGKFYQNGVEKNGNYLLIEETNDYKGIFKYKGEVIIIKKIVHFNPVHIFINVNPSFNSIFEIRINSAMNSIKNILGKGNLSLGKYEFLGSKAHFNQIETNLKIVEILEKNDLHIKLSGTNKPYLLLKPFHGILSQKKCEEYLDLLLLIKQKIFC